MKKIFFILLCLVALSCNTTGRLGLRKPLPGKTTMLLIPCSIINRAVHSKYPPSFIYKLVLENTLNKKTTAINIGGDKYVFCDSLESSVYRIKSCYYIESMDRIPINLDKVYISNNQITLFPYKFITELEMNKNEGVIYGTSSFIELKEFEKKIILDDLENDENYAYWKNLISNAEQNSSEEKY